MKKINAFPFYKQYDAMDCGPACLRMIAKVYGKTYRLQTLRTHSQIAKDGVSLLGISQAAETLGFHTLSVRLTFQTLRTEAPLPCIVHWRQNHFVVVYKISAQHVWVADPGKGLITYTVAEFCSHWLSTQTNGYAEGVVLLLEPTPTFYEQPEEKTSRYSFRRVAQYLFAYKKLLLQLILGLAIGSILQLVFPFLTQSVVDVGIRTRNLNFVYLILAAQVMLFLGRMSVDFIRGWILLHISTRLNLSILSDFLSKLMRLPLSFFDVKMFGDIMQRIGDHRRIESFLTNNTLNILFSLFNLFIFSGILAVYYLPIFLVFLVASVLYGGWVTFFLRFRRNLDLKRFELSSNEHSNLVGLIQGMQEIKLANAELPKRWEWEHIQARLFRLSVKSLALNQYQQAGAFFVNEGKNIFITFLSAQAVIAGSMTLGEMLAVQYIIGQLNSPIEQLLQFLQTAQDAQLSLERLNEIHELADEEPTDLPLTDQLPSIKSMAVRKMSFQYSGAGNESVLQEIDLFIPEGKTTAIVGTSGSGKTTLLKLLLKFYQPSAGEIRVGETPLSYLSHKLWRSQCGVVMQDGFIFSDTIAQNIAVGEQQIDIQKLLHAVKVANIQAFIESLPLGYNTKIGAEGNGISQGQRQRILIARAVYKDPHYIFFDEATNALDANNESVIMQNLESFFKGRTVVVVAHRLSTVKNADTIIVLEKGRIVEQGSHAELVYREGKYYELVRNQLELGV